ncbi:hypothetical protein ACP275_02G187200 [Erythranthe tilingii]
MALSENEEIIRVWDCGSPLYDSYEVVAISNLIERHFMKQPYLSGSRIDDDLSRPEKRAKNEAGPTCKNARKYSCVRCFLSGLALWKRKKMNNNGEGKEKAMKKKKKKAGFFKINFPCRVY